MMVRARGGARRAADHIGQARGRAGLGHGCLLFMEKRRGAPPSAGSRGQESRFFGKAATLSKPEEDRGEVQCLLKKRCHAGQRT